MSPTRLVRLFILLVLTATAGGARASEVAIPFTLATGDSHRLAVTLTQERYQGSERPMAITASAFVDVAVLGKRGTDLIVAWTYRDLQVEGGGPQAKLFRDLFGVLEGQRIEYYLDQDGAVVGLVEAGHQVEPAHLAGGARRPVGLRPKPPLPQGERRPRSAGPRAI